ncbi:MAG: multiheme c-type cytochrome [Pseudomonadota bacterium]
MKFRLFAAFGFAALVGGVLTAPNAALAQSDEVYSGVTTCANSQCHGAATVNPDSRVNRNEFTVWHDKDPHSKSYKSLQSDRAKRIASNLNLGEATQAPLCLSCHANNVAPENRAPDFDITEGVTCEVCHGSSVLWLGPHRLPDRFSHTQLVDLGLFPTNDPAKRADMCLDCHFGAEDQFANHRIFGAGHPRITFELDSYTWINAHHTADQDYFERKDVADGVRTWAVGAAKMIERRMTLLANDQTGTNGFFPEFAFFDCNTCHHRMSDLRYKPRNTGVAPGTPKLDDSHMTVLMVALGRADPALADSLRSQMLALHKSSTVGRGQLVAETNRMKELAAQAAASIGSYEMTGDDMRAVLGALVDKGSSGNVIDFASAEQTALVVGATIDALEQGGHISGAEGEALFAELGKAYDAINDDEKFRPDQFASAMKSLKAAIR